jgi:hypothetical protein
MSFRWLDIETPVSFVSVMVWVVGRLVNAHPGRRP